METRPLGRTDLRVSRIGLGTAPIGHLYAPVPEDQAQATVRAALDAGITLFDTAPLYGAGLSERRLGTALAGLPRAAFVLSTKVGRRVQPDGSVVFDWTRDGILRSIEESLVRLGLERIDIVHLHDVDAAFSDPAEAHRAALDVAFPTLAELRAQGVIGAIGAGMNQWEMPAHFARHADFDCFLLAGRYTLLEQGGLPLLRLCRKRGIAVLLGGVFNSGILATGARPGAKYNYADAPPDVLARVARLEAVCAEFGVPLATAALHFPLRHPAVTALVLGAVAPAEVRQNLAALAAPVPPELWQAFGDAGLADTDID
jgi:D-threo-aldose 1-dehydrogenase